MANEKVLIVSTASMFDFDMIEKFQAHGWTVQHDATSFSWFMKDVVGKNVLDMPSLEDWVVAMSDDSNAPVSPLGDPRYIEICLDVSGSMSDAEYETFLKEIEND